MEMIYNVFQLYASDQFVDQFSNGSVGGCIIGLPFCVVWMLWGWRCFRFIVTLQWIIIGALLGYLLFALIVFIVRHYEFSEALGLVSQRWFVWFGVVPGAAAFGMLAWTLTRFFYTIWALFMGALVGFLSSFFILSKLNLIDQAWAGWIVLGSLIGGAVLYFLMMLFYYRPTIMQLTSMEGAVMAVHCVLVLLIQSPKNGPTIKAVLNAHPTWPFIAFIVLAVLGFVVQFRRDFGELKKLAKQPKEPTVPIYSVDTMVRAKGGAIDDKGYVKQKV